MDQSNSRWTCSYASGLSQQFLWNIKVFGSLICHSVFFQKSSIRLQIQTLKEGISTITEYLNRAKILVNTLATIDSPLLGEDLVLAILHGLSNEYDALIHVTSRVNSTSLDELHGLLLSQETCTESQNQEMSPIELPTTTLYTTKSPQGWEKDG